MSKIWSYPKSVRVDDICQGFTPGYVNHIQEKLDGSQFSFGVIDGELHMRSKGSTVHSGTSDKNFGGAVKHVELLFSQGRLPANVIFRAEALARPRHNVLSYSRVPKNHIVLFDVEDGTWAPGLVETYAPLLEVEAVQRFWRGDVAPTAAELASFLAKESMLGGQIEGLVFKPYGLLDKDGHQMLVKYVRDEFKEVASGRQVMAKNAKADKLAAAVAKFRTKARWDKAIRHLTDAGKLEGSPKDIGPLIREIVGDTLLEERSAIEQTLFKCFESEVRKELISGFPEYYQAKLAEIARDLEVAWAGLSVGSRGTSCWTTTPVRRLRSTKSS